VAVEFRSSSHSHPFSFSPGFSRVYGREKLETVSTVSWRVDLVASTKDLFSCPTDVFIEKPLKRFPRIAKTDHPAEAG
jgi:hypothetical protein